MVDSAFLNKFHGGLKLRHHKNESLQNGLARSTLPEKLAISLRINVEISQNRLLPLAIMC